MYDTLRRQIKSLNSAGSSLGEIEKFKDAVIQSELTLPQKTLLLQEIRDISFNKGIELDIPYEFMEQFLEGESFKVENIETVEIIEDEKKQKDIGFGNNEVQSLFDEKSKNLLLDYKRYFLFKLENINCPKKSLIIHDGIPAPELVKRILSEFDTTVCLKDFLIQLKDENSELRSSSNICLLITSNLSEDINTLLTLENSLNEFDNFKYCELIPQDNGFLAYEYEGEKLFEALKTDINISLTNADLDKAEESLIKRFFPSESSLIRYKLLKGGRSGSKVVEVSQVFNVVRPCKYVIKIGLRKGGKVSKEESAVKRWVSSLVPDYQTEQKENSTHEALKYNFASKDGKGDSISFGDYFETQQPDKIKGIVGKLFEQNLFCEWEDTQSVTNKPITIFDLYKDFLDKDRIFQVVNIIAFDKAERTINLINKVLNIVLPKYVTKACHGDLHSENIIIDDGHVFLIDFGMTDVRHCFIDYSTLEASIRLKLTASYYPSEILQNADNDFLYNFDVTDASLTEKIQNSALKKSYAVISKIRSDAINKVIANQETYSIPKAFKI